MKENWADYYHKISILFNGLIAISIVPFGLILLKIQVGKDRIEPLISPVFSSILIWIILGLAIWVSWMVLQVTPKKYKQFKSKILIEKLIFFKQIETKSYLLLTLVAVLSMLGLRLTANFWFVIIYFIILAQYSILNPSEKRIRKKMDISDEEFANFKEI